MVPSDSRLKVSLVYGHETLLKQDSPREQRFNTDALNLSGQMSAFKNPVRITTEFNSRHNSVTTSLHN